MTNQQFTNDVLAQAWESGAAKVVTHVDQRLIPGGRQQGKSWFNDIRNLVQAGEQVIECIGNGDFFGNTESNIDAAVNAVDRLEAAIQVLKSKGF